MDPLTLLVVTTDPDRAARLTAAASQPGPQRISVDSGEAAAEALGVPGIEGVLIDLALPGLDHPALRRALTPASPVPPDTLADAERRHIMLALAHTRGNKRQAALLLGISRSTLLHKVRRYRLEAVAVRGGASG